MPPVAATAESFRAIVRITIIAAILAFCIYRCVDMIRPSKDLNALWSRQVLNLYYLGNAMQRYEAEQGSVKWPSWKVLIAKSNESVYPQFAGFVDPQSGQTLPWIYAAEDQPIEGPRRVLIAAPLPRPPFLKGNLDEQRAVLWSDFTAWFISEKEFQTFNLKSR